MNVPQSHHFDQNINREPSSEELKAIESGLFPEEFPIWGQPHNPDGLTLETINSLIDECACEISEQVGGGTYFIQPKLVRLLIFPRPNERTRDGFTGERRAA